MKTAKNSSMQFLMTVMIVDAIVTFLELEFKREKLNMEKSTYCERGIDETP